MNNLKKMMLLMMSLTIVVTISSCLGDDDKNDPKTLTPTQMASQLFEMAGNYSGQVFFTNDSTYKLDSIPCTWQITAPDSAITIPDFPIALFANGIKDSLARNTLLNGGKTTFRALLRPYYNDNYTKGDYTFWMLPIDYKLAFAIYRNDTTYDVTVDFTYSMQANYVNGLTSTFYSIGEYIEREIVSYILVKDVVFNGKSYTTGWASFIYGKK